MNECGFKLDSKEGPYNSGKEYENGNMGHRPGIKGGYFPVPPVDSEQDMRSEYLKAMKEINNEQLGWLEITYLSKKLRICRGDKGTLFVLRKINSPTLFKNFKEFIKIY